MAAEDVAGFISVRSRSMDGRASLSVNHITAIGPTRIRSNGAEECAVMMDGLSEVVVAMRREDVILLIAEAIGAIPVGTGAQLDRLLGSVRDNTRRMRLALEGLHGLSDQVGVIQQANRDRVNNVDAKIRDNTRRMAEVLDSASNQ